MTRMRLHISYDGTGYLGWQKQTKQEGLTIQGELEKALFKLTGETIPTTGSSRTDAGVHADDQVVHFNFLKDPDPFDWVRGLNRFLPESIRIQKAFCAPKSFHALHDSISKTYVYNVQDGAAPDPINSRYSHWISSPVDIDYLNALTKCLIGEHDFKSFQTTGTSVATTVREIHEFSWIRTSLTTLEARISGNGFLKQMIRNMVGSLLHQYWQKSLSEEQIKGVLEMKNRSKAFGTAPAHGLRLHRVKYPAELDKNCIKS